MKYMLMMHAPRGTGDYQVGNWSPDDFKAHIDFMHGLNRDLTASGELVGAEGLAAPTSSPDAVRSRLRPCMKSMWALKSSGDQLPTW